MINYPFLDKNDIVDELWRAYMKSDHYKKDRLIKGISSRHPLLIKQETIGLKRIYINFVEKLETHMNLREEFQNRDVHEWLNEWKNMHKQLFHFIYKRCGNWRNTDVRFGSPGDEERYRVPKYRDVSREISALAHKIKNEYIKLNYQSDMRAYTALARVHYEFIRIHPFSDGNGRIARAVTDQLAIFFGFPAAMAGYPRLDKDKRERYHKSIEACISDPECEDLSIWIKGYIEHRISELA